MNPPTLADIERAREALARRAPPTPLLHSAALSRLTGADVHLKLECLGPTGSFKWRGAANRLTALTDAERRRGVMTASTGNHGAAVAWAAHDADMRATVVLPHGVPDIKRDAIADAGADILVQGANWNESCARARRLAAERGMLYVEDGEDPAIMAGAGTLALEVLDALPDVQDVVMAVGGGNLIAGCAIAVKGRAPAARVIGVQSEAAPGSYLSWRIGRITEAACDTFAGGMATTGPVPMAFDVMRRAVDDMLLVSEDELMRAIGLIAARHALIAEGAGAAALAAVLRYPALFAGRRVALVITGRNLDPRTLAAALAPLPGGAG